MPLSLQQSQAASQQQQQQQRLSQYQRASLEVLQKTAQQLRDDIRQELAANPMLQEVVPEVITLDEMPRDERRRQRDEDTADGDGKQYAEDRFRDVVEGQAAFDNERRLGDSSRREDPDAAELRDYRINSLTRGAGLLELMTAAVRSDVPGTPQFKAICETLVGQMDDNGFIPDDDEELARIAECDTETVRRARQALQTLDPPGICARDLRECLMIQLERMGRRNTLEWRIVSEQWQALSAGSYTRVADALDCDEADVMDALAELRESCDPHPGWQVRQPEAAPSVVADVVIERNPDGSWEINCNHDLVPLVEVNPEYLELSQKDGVSAEDKKWFDEKLGEANRLIQHLEARESTLKRLCLFLLERQPRVFQTGQLADLEPMTQAECARAMEVVPSTICRTVNDKFLRAPGLGVKELKDFFTVGFRADDGHEISALKMSQRLQEIFNAEDKASPLSDDDVSRMLKREGFRISRRTVTKYRLRENIPSSFERRIR